jgi:hypothetical protein
MESPLPKGWCSLCGSIEPTLIHLAKHIATKHRCQVNQVCFKCNQLKVVAVHADWTCWGCMPNSGAISNASYDLNTLIPAYTPMGEFGQTASNHIADGEEAYVTPNSLAEGGRGGINTDPSPSGMQGHPNLVCSKVDNPSTTHVYQELTLPRGAPTQGEADPIGPMLPRRAQKGKKTKPPFGLWANGPLAPATMPGNEPEQANRVRGPRSPSAAHQGFLNGLHRVLPSITCPVCGEAMLLMSFSTHFQRKHPDYQVVCPICGITFVSPTHYQAHMRTTHYAIYDEDRGYCHNVMAMVEYRRLMDRVREDKLPHHGDGRSAPELALARMRGGKRKM